MVVMVYGPEDRIPVDLPPEPSHDRAIVVHGLGGIAEPGQEFPYDDVLVWVDPDCTNCLEEHPPYWATAGWINSGYYWHELVRIAMRNGYRMEVLGATESARWREEKRA